MATGDVAVEIQGCQFTGAHTSADRSSDGSSYETNQSLNAGGVRQMSNPNDNLSALITVEHKTGGPYNRPSLFSALDPTKQYTVKFIEQ